VAQSGKGTVDSPMVIARLLADEGADLRHSEIMNLYVERASDRPHDAALRNILNIDNLASAARSIRHLENLRLKYKSENDKEGLRHVRETGLHGKQIATELAEKVKLEAADKLLNAEIAQWFRIWLETPEVFENWLILRQRSPDFVDKFGEITDK